MNRFADILREADRRLDLPPPVRHRIVLEMAADLEDVFEHYVGRGLPEEEAEERARESFALGDESLDELIEIHTSGFRRFLDQLGEQGRRAWERIVFALLLLFVVGLVATQITARDLLRDAGPGGWIVAALTLAAVAVSIRAFYALYLKQDGDLHRIGDWLPAILVLGGAEILTGVCGWIQGLHAWLRAFDGTDGLDLEPLARTLANGSALAVVALLCALATALLWYVLQARLARLEMCSALALLED